MTDQRKRLHSAPSPPTNLYSVFGPVLLKDPIWRKTLPISPKPNNPEVHLYLDRTDWLQSPWDTEPDTVIWTDQITGIQCQISRNSLFGHLNGYIGIAPGHPWYGLEEDQLPTLIPAVHGGITYASSEPKSEDDITPFWWIGFDCGHASDHWPSAIHPKLGSPAVYRTLSYVRDEVLSLAKHAELVALRALRPEPPATPE